STRIHLDQILKEAGEFILAGRSKPHSLVFVTGRIKSESCGDGAEYHSQRVGEPGLAVKPQFGSGSRHERGRSHVSDVTSGYNGGLIETRSVKGGSGMCHLMVHRDKTAAGTKPFSCQYTGLDPLAEVVEAVDQIVWKSLKRRHTGTEQDS